MCDSGQCVPYKLACDSNFDCFDRSDEHYCPGSCDFEGSNCDWRDDLAGILQDFQGSWSETGSRLFMPYNIILN